ncbi:hypothetical protein HK102_004528, partial [Quaeritorhiza haematococci]
MLKIIKNDPDHDNQESREERPDREQRRTNPGSKHPTKPQPRSQQTTKYSQQNNLNDSKETHTKDPAPQEEKSQQWFTDPYELAAYIQRLLAKALRRQQQDQFPNMYQQKPADDNGPDVETRVLKAIELVTRHKGAANAEVYGTLLAGLTRLGRHELVWQIYKQMLARRLSPTPQAYTIILSSLASRASSRLSNPSNRAARLSDALLLWTDMDIHLAARAAQEEYNPKPNFNTSSPHSTSTGKSTIHANALLRVCRECADVGGWQEGIEIYREMIAEVFKEEKNINQKAAGKVGGAPKFDVEEGTEITVPLPDMVTFDTVLRMCADNRCDDGFEAAMEVWSDFVRVSKVYEAMRKKEAEAEAERLKLKMKKWKGKKKNYDGEVKAKMTTLRSRIPSMQADGRLLTTVLLACIRARTMDQARQGLDIVRDYFGLPTSLDLVEKDGELDQAVLDSSPNENKKEETENNEQTQTAPVSSSAPSSSPDNPENPTTPTTTTPMAQQLDTPPSSSSTPTSSPSPSQSRLDEWFHHAENLLFGRNNTKKDEKKAIKYLKKAAFPTSSKSTSTSTSGHVYAQAVLGFCYEFGLGTDQEFKASENLYICAAIKGNGLAQARLAFLRRYGRPSVKIDRVEAEEWIKRVSEQGPDAVSWLQRAADEDNHPAANYALGVCYHDGVGVDKDPCKAVYYYERSAAAGQPRGEGILGYCYGEGFGVEKDEEKAFALYLKAAKRGESVSMYNVAHCYEEGIGIPKDLSLAVTWYTKSAHLGNCYAQNSLGYMYEEGLGVDRDEVKAVYWYRLSAEQGYPWAQCNLGFCLQNGIGVEKNEGLGAYWYQMAAIQGHSRAQHNLGHAFQYGIGLPLNESLAVSWYTRSASAGNAFALHSLGYCYQYGIGTPINEAKALELYHESATLGHAPAQLSLGCCYRSGIGVEVDEAEAF